MCFIKSMVSSSSCSSISVSCPNSEGSTDTTFQFMLSEDSPSDSKLSVSISSSSSGLGVYSFDSSCCVSEKSLLLTGGLSSGSLFVVGLLVLDTSLLLIEVAPLSAIASLPTFQILCCLRHCDLDMGFFPLYFSSLNSSLFPVLNCLLY